MNKNNKKSTFLRGTITEVPEDKLFGIITTDDGREIYYDILHYLDNPKTKNHELFKFPQVNDKVVFKAKEVQRTILRPIELYHI